MLCCPLCRQPLARVAQAWRCAAGHSFDVAREGYLNLLPVQYKKSRAPGDNADMVQARRDFLAAGHYAPLRAAVVAALDAAAPARVLDIGCGEGYYTVAMARAGREVTGIDISKPAIRSAAKQAPQLRWLVGSCAQLPLADGSVDAVCSLFSPLPAAEMRRVLRPGGLLLVATPAADHLLTLRAALFDDVRAHRPDKFVAALDRDFVPVATQEVRVPLVLDAASLQALLLMTPYAWRATRERRAALAAAAGFVTEAAFTLLQFRPRTVPA